MAYVAPNSTVEFFSDLGLNDNYDDTLYFASESAKNSYFSGLTKLATGTAMTYTREQRGFLRVELPMSTLISASYMRYKNTSFENKWFYAFIKNVEYINNNCTQVNFSIDPMMTWMGTFHLNQCFIERQHVSDDAIGANLVEENLDYGDYIYINSSPTGFFDDNTDYATIVLTTLNYQGTGFDSTYDLYEGVYAAAKPHIYMTNTQAGKDALQTFVINVNTNGFQDAIVSMYQVPTQFVSNVHTPLICAPVSKPYHDIDGYVPKNNKLFTYPYNVLEVSNMEGVFTEYKYEFFSTPSNVNFEIIYNFLAPVQAVLYPKYYKGITNNYQDSTVMGSFPSSSFPNDTYKAYLAQVGSNALVSAFHETIGGAVKGGLSGGTSGAIIGAGMGLLTLPQQAMSPLVEKVANKLGGRSYRANRPNLANGSATVSSFYANHLKDFYFNKKQIKAEFAEIIDNYFTMFGYSILKAGVPNMNVRPYWTFVKTIGCSVDGDIPADDASTIENIFNKGVRFWKNHNNIGNYSLNNTPT